MRRTLLTLFAGGGLADLGAKAAGYTPVGAVEWDPAIAAIYADNHGDHVTVAPVEEVDYRPYAGVHAAWFSPCCTNASVANSDGEEAEADRSAAAAIVRCLREARPEVCVLENVWAYREFDSFQTILRGLWDLGYRFAFEHVNAADHGVAQTRRRLILRAWRRAENVPLLAPTHCEGGRGGGLFDGEWGLLPWNGWYAAVEDLLPECPESRLAEWQLRRLPERLETLLVNSKDSGPHAQPNPRRAGEPAMTVMTVDAAPRAVLVDGQNLTVHGEPITREGTEPALGVFASAGRGMPRALLVSNAATERTDGLREGAEPALAVTRQHGGRLRAVLVQESSTMDLREAAEPAASVVASPRSANARAILEGARVVQLTPRCLARFQSVPDSYALPEKRALACRVIGNGVPALLAQRVLESLT